MEILNSCCENAWTMEMKEKLQDTSSNCSKRKQKNGTLLSCPNKNEVRSTQPKSKSILEGFFEHDWSDISQHFVCIHTIHTHY